ncbi:hypothetical protein QTP70_010715 [Hemibagrus guttatus]|uniref:Galectin domain-containing protein n=1 Tax=Hemibagrus guttatus TaxID=175788 RepID=A0AAE0R9K9_9TELE|nr:hypothetical protein QTP70_010715 [Hemibagrus guttatus]
MDRTEENRQEYKELQRRVKREVSKAKQKAYDELYTRLHTREGEKNLYRLARQRDQDGKHVQQVRVIKDRDGRVLTSEESVQRRWKEYFEELMNEENEREKRVEGVNSVEQKVDKIRKDEVRKALKRMKSGKEVGPDDILVEVWKCLGEAAVEFLTSLFNRVLESERMPEEWRRSVLVPIFKNKGDVQSCSNYRGIKLMSHTMKLWERVVEAWLRKVVEICEQQYGFMLRKSTTDAIFAQRILMEKYRVVVSRSKTEYMCVNEREGSGTVRLQGEEVKKVQEFKYLGSTVQSNGECGKEVKKRVQAGWNGWKKVSVVLCDRKISVRIKGKVYRTVVRPAMLYGLETVSLKKRQESELEVAELKMLRFSLGVTRLDRIRNEYIRGTAHVGCLGDKVREARLRWFGHVQRREKEEDEERVTMTTMAIMSIMNTAAIMSIMNTVAIMNTAAIMATMAIVITALMESLVFQINFKTGINNTDEVAFHFNPRIGKYVYMNSFKNGKWQKEELGPEKPFVMGASFKLLFLINDDSYEVHVNGQHLYTFKHRIPLESVSTLGIVGNVSIYWLGFEDWKETTTTTFTIPCEISNPVTQPTIPYVGPIAGGIRPGTRLHVQGTVHPNAKEFQINFKTGINNTDDVAFHFNPRIGQYVYMNIFKNGKWQKEELGPEKPFGKGTFFKLLFLINDDSYKVHVHGQHLYTFKHRIPLESVSTLGIVGDVSINWLGFEDWKETTTTTFTIPCEISNPVTQPTIPYVGPIAGGIRPGTRLHVQGTVHPNAKEFQINFKTGINDADDVAFHFNPRIGQYVYMNIFKNGKWQKEELGPEKPFGKGTFFKLLFLINDDSYKELPYVGGIPGGLKQDKAIVFQGTVPANANCFAINFKTGPSDGDDIAFHYTPRFGDITTLNSFRNGKWETPENAPDKPFTKGGAFIILVVINSEGYEVFVNGLKHCTFKHRIPLEKVSTVNVCGDVSLLVWGFIDRFHIQSVTLFVINLKTGPSDGDDIAFHYNPRIGNRTCLNCYTKGDWQNEEHASDKPFIKGEAFQMLIDIKSDSYEALPYVGGIPGGLKQDKAIVFQGTVPANANCFAINFKTGPSDGDDIAFHYTPRFGDITTLNSFRNGKWETPENAPDKPFTKGGAFIILVVINSEGYEVFVNGLKHCTFKHRIPLEKVSTVNVCGDVSLLVWGFIDRFHIQSVTLFVINLKTGPSDGDDIAFHYNPRIGNRTCLNCYTKGDWQNEEHASDKPFIKGEAFQMLIDIKSDSYEALPYVGGIPGGLKQDKAIVFQGTVPANANCFAINFKTGPSDGDDIAFHYTPRFGDITTLNSFRNGKWETPENAPDKPFTKGGAFIILVVINSEGYEVFVNGLKHCTFKHRIPLEKVSTVNVCGDVSLLVWGFIDRFHIQSVTLFVINLKTGPSDGDDIAFHYNPRIGNRTCLNCYTKGDWQNEEHASDKPFIKGEAFQMLIDIKSDSYEALPYVGGIPGGLKQDKAIVFQGTVPANANCFAINFKTGPSDGDDIAFHYTPRFGDITTLNSFRNGKWETPENAPDKPFTKGGAFIILVVINSEGYEVFVNGLKHCTFKHRIPLEKVSTVNVCGDVSLLVWGFIDRFHIQSVTLFVINLKTGPSDGDDIAFHYNPRIGNRTCLNCYTKGDWQNEEHASDKPFIKGEAFQMLIDTSNRHFAINFKTGPSDGDDIAFHYTPRFGDITTLNSFRNGKWETPENAPDKPFTKGGAFIILVVINSEGYEALPYVGKVPGGLRQDRALFLQGTVPADANGFAINFKTGPSAADDIAFHYNPRIGDITTLNSFRNGKWETPENAPDKPFTKGEPFQMIVPINSEGYESWSTSSVFTELQKIPVTESLSTIWGSTPFQISHPIRNPTLPYVGKIPGGIKQDMAVFVQGTIPPDAKSFAINFKTGPSAGDDIAFHYNPRIGDITTLNSFRNGKWETPENAPDKPFTKGEPFQLIVPINSEDYKSWSTSSVFTELQKIPVTESLSTIWGSTPFQISHPIRNPTLPYVGKIPGGIKQDMAVFVQGTIPPDAKSFAINFKTGPSAGDDIAFHYNPRIGDITTLNSFRNGKWETPENAPDKPFTKGEPFQLIVPINSEDYKSWSTSSVFTELQKIPVTESLSTIWGSTPFQISHPIRNPTLPYVGKIPGGIKQDMAVFVQGTIPPDAKSFAINFKTGPSAGDDIAFHYNPRIGDITTLNSFRNGKWETPENAPDKPFTKGEPFQLIVAINSEDYKTLPYVGKIPGGIKQDMAVFFQGTIPPDAKSFAINFKTGPSAGDDIAFHYTPRFGDITTLNSFRNGKWETPENAPDKPFTKGEPFQLIVAINSEDYKTLPYVGKIPGGIKQDMAVFFQGTIPPDAKSFAINFKTGPSAGDDIAFHYNPRIGDITTLNSFRNGKWETPENAPDKPFTKGGAFQMIVAIKSEGYETLPYVGKIPGGIKQDMAVFVQGTIPPDAKSFAINFKTGPSAGDDIAFHYNPRIGDITTLNSFRNGKWETPENAPDKPFTKGEPFQLIVAINSEGYEVYVNGIRQCVFKHRIPLENVSALELNGDLSQLICGFIHSWSTSSFFTELQKISVTEISSTTTESTTFTIDFTAGDDIAFRYKPEIGDHTTLNSFRNGNWDTEEKAPDKPFTKGEGFQIIVVMKSEGYQVYVNTMSHCTFKHRMPLEKVSAIAVHGDITIQLIGFVENWRIA